MASKGRAVRLSTPVPDISNVGVNEVPVSVVADTAATNPLCKFVLHFDADPFDVSIVGIAFQVLAIFRGTLNFRVRLREPGAAGAYVWALNTVEAQPATLGINDIEENGVHVHGFASFSVTQEPANLQVFGLDQGSIRPVERSNFIVRPVALKPYPTWLIPEIRGQRIPGCA